jgi:N6-L-threonylcarbamoyladenine synthase
VAANRQLRERLFERSQETETRLCISPLEYCTDNAAMGAIALEKYARGMFESLDLDINAGLLRA